MYADTATTDRLKSYQREVAEVIDAYHAAYATGLLTPADHTRWALRIALPGYELQCERYAAPWVEAAQFFGEAAYTAARADWQVLRDNAIRELAHGYVCHALTHM